MSADPRPLLREMAVSDRRGAVWCAAQCARTVLDLVPGEERRPLRAVLVAEAWASGVDLPGERMIAATDDAAAYAAYAAAADVADAAYAANAAAYAAAARAAAYAAYAAHVAYVATAAWAAADVADAAYAAADTAAYARAYDAWSASRDRHLADLHALVAGQVAPSAPTLADVQRAEPAVAVAWDRTVERQPDPMRHGSLSDALSRARVLRLRWRDPVQRAIAERCADPVGAALYAVLGVAP